MIKPHIYPHFPWPEEEMINQRDDSLSWGGKTVKFPFLTQAKRLAVQRLRVSSKEVEAASIANLSEVLLRMVNETFLAAVSDGSELLLAIQEGLDCLEEKPLGMLEIVTSYRRFGANSWEPVNPADELKANLLFGLDISRLLKKGPGIYLSFRGIPVHLVLFSKEGGDFLAMGVMVATEEKINTYNYKQRLPLRKLSD
jgi:hypothetical protein